MVFKVLIVMSSFLLLAKMTSSTTINYVKPFAHSLCSDVLRFCLTLNEYINDLDEYFINNTIFYFHPGIHKLDDRIILENLYNFSFQGWPHDDQVVNITVAMGSLAGISLKGSYNVKISSISFVLNDNFTFVVRLVHSQSVLLSNISIYGNGHSGCSSIISQESALGINNASFIQIKGFVGAALMMLTSNITFRGSNMFAYNRAISGGSIYSVANSTLILNGTNLFLNSTSSKYSEKLVNRRMSLCNYHHVENANGSGDMLFNYASSNISGNFSLSTNVAKYYGGAMFVLNGNLTIQGYA